MAKWIFLLCTLTPLVLSAQSWEEKAEQSKQAINQPVRAIELVDLEGNARSFDELFGKPSVIYFFASWCTPCYKSLGDIEKVSTQNTIDTRLIALALDRDKNAVKRMLDRTGFTGEVWLAKSGKIPLKERYFANWARALPYVISLDQETRIIESSYNIDSPEQWKALLADKQS